jgi:hypothetical protein
MKGLVAVPKLEDLISNPATVNDLPAAAIPDLLRETQRQKAHLDTQRGQLETVITFLSVRLATPNSPAHHREEAESDEDWVTVKEAARISGFSPKWFYRRWKKLSFANRPPGLRKGIRINKRKFLKWLAERRA